MKRKLIATLMGFAACVTASYGQGYVSFDNYVTFDNAGAPIYLNTIGHPLVPVGGTVQLWYQLGTAANPVGLGTLLATTTIGSGGAGAGYYIGGNVVVPDYVSGNISFQVSASYLGLQGVSQTLVLSAIATGTSIPTELDIPSFSFPIPEPSGWALGTLAFAMLLVPRRWKMLLRPGFARVDVSKAESPQ